MPARLSFRHVILIIAATACWGGGTVLSKQVLERGVAPLTLLVIELAASCLLLLGSMIVLRTAWVRGPALGKLAMLGILNPGLAYALGLLGLATVSASMAVLLWGTEPVLILVPAGKRIVRAEVQAEFAYKVADTVSKKVTVFDDTNFALTYEGTVRRVATSYLPRRAADVALTVSPTKILEVEIEIADPAPPGKPPLRVGQPVRVSFE